MRLTHYDEHKKRWQINDDYGAVMIDELNYAVGEAIDKLAAYEDAEEQGLLVILPCPMDSTVYRICPKCNDRHDGSCRFCAWNGTGGWNGCDVFGLWENGEFPAERCTIVPWKATWRTFPIVIKEIGKRIFRTREEAEAAMDGGQDDV